MTYLMHFQHGSRLSWNRDFLKFNDQKGDVSSIRLNMLQRILRITLGSLASLIGINAFYASTILNQKRIAPFAQTKNPSVVVNIETLVCALNCFGKNLSYQAPVLNPFEHTLESKNTEDNKLQEEGAKEPIIITRYFSDDNPPIPKDVAGLILSWLDFKDVVRMKQVNRTWNQLIGRISNSLTKQFVDSCYSEAAKALVDAPVNGKNQLETFKVQGEIFRGFMILLKSLVHYDTELTRKTVMIAKQKASELMNDYKDYTLREIAKVEAVYDLETAKQTAATIEHSFMRNEAIFHLSLYFEKNFARAKELALEQGHNVGDYSFKNIIEIEAETDIPAAQETLLSIQNLHVRNQAKIEIIRKLARTDRDAAQRMSAELENPLYRYEAELEIALLEPQPNFQPAIATAKTIVNGEDNEQERALAQIAIIQERFDRAAAQTTLDLIPKNSFRRNWPNHKFAEQEAQRDMRIAMQFLLTAGKNSEYVPQMVLLKHIARRNMWEAKTSAHSFKNIEKRVDALTDLAEFALNPEK